MVRCIKGCKFTIGSQRANNKTFFNRRHFNGWNLDTIDTFSLNVTFITDNGLNKNTKNNSEKEKHVRKFFLALSDAVNR